jgi:hypothetical protein
VINRVLIQLGTIARLKSDAFEKEKIEITLHPNPSSGKNNFEVKPLFSTLIFEDNHYKNDDKVSKFHLLIG